MREAIRDCSVVVATLTQVGGTRVRNPLGSLYRGSEPRGDEVRGP